MYQCFILGTLKNLVCHVWWALQYLSLWATNRNQRPEGTEGSAIKKHLIKRAFWYSFLCEKLLVYENVGHVSGKNVNDKLNK